MLPILYQSHDLVIYSYPLLLGIAWGVAYQIYFNAPAVATHFKSSQFLFWGLFLASWVGAKILFYWTSSSDQNLLSQMSFWTGGGLVFYGGLLASLMFLFIYKLIFKDFSWERLNPLLPSLAIGHGVGRIGCFLAGCCYGSPTKTIWGVFLHGHFRHPTQLLEAFGLLSLGYFLLKLKHQTGSIVLAYYFIIYSILRMVIEALRGDEIRGNWMGHSPSLWISISLLVIGVGLLYLNKFKRLKSS